MHLSTGSDKVWDSHKTWQIFYSLNVLIKRIRRMREVRKMPDETKSIWRICRIYSGWLNSNSSPNMLNEIMK
jgi:hypothetical protein